jgi:hypothetical protein
MAALEDIVKTGQQYNMLPTDEKSAPATNTIPYWGYFSQGGALDSDPAGNPLAQQFLAGLRKYDPDATFVQHSGGGEGASDTSSWQLQYDGSKVPGGKLGGGNIDLNPGDYAPQYWSPNSSPGESFEDYKQANPDAGNFKAPLYNPNAVGVDSVYGRVTSPQNVNRAAGDASWLDTLGPAAAMLIGTVLSGGALSPAMAAILKTPQTLNNIGSGGNPLAALLSLAGSASGIPGGSTIGSVVGNSINTPRGG